MSHTSLIQPEFSRFVQLARKGNLVPVYRELLGDLETPVSAFFKIAGSKKACFLLESAEYGEKIGRYSFLGFDPSLVVEADPSIVRIHQTGQRERVFQNTDLLSTLERIFHEYRCVAVPELRHFCGGFVGYLNYENVRFYESLNLRTKPGLKLPYGVFLLADRVLVFDHLEKKLKIVVLARTHRTTRQAYKEAIALIESIVEDLRRPGVLKGRPAGRPSKRPSSFRSNMGREEFVRKVKRIKDYIRAGDCIQVVFSQRFDLGRVRSGFELYRGLRTINPSPYMFYFRYGDLELVGSSPEVLVKKVGRRAEIRPIAGTRPRGWTEEEDLRLEKELQQNEKELAEHLMLVDLARNDLGRVCSFETVEVKDYARVERYSHVMHLVTQITGRLEKKDGAFSLLRAAFPAGTVTGAPKIRAMEIIDELEEETRGPYAGCLGYLSFSGDMDMCIMIRTLVVKSGRAYAQAGAGILMDSIPSREYQETVNKASALFQAVELSENLS